jgi:hypothetical protein
MTVCRKARFSAATRTRPIIARPPVKLLKSLLVAVALGMAGFAAWLLFEAVALHWEEPPAVELDDLPQPTAELTFDEMLRIQLDALQHNDELDTGIATAFNFASPSNRSNFAPRGTDSKGPQAEEPDSADDQRETLRNFARMLRGPQYRFMLNHESAEFGPEFVQGDEARQIVTMTSADGEEVQVLFVVRRQRQAPYEGCWMTDGVQILSRRPPPAERDAPVVEA